MGKYEYTPPKNGWPEWNNNPEIVELNRLEPHTDVVPIEDRENFRKESSPWYLSLNGTWKFRMYERPAQVVRDYIAKDYEAEGWADIRVPGHWQLQGWDYPQYTNIRYPWEGTDEIDPPFAPVNYNPVGCYLTEFEVPESWKGRSVRISFQGVESAFYVWLNGDFLGYSQDSFTPAEFDVTPYLEEGKNRLAVEVYRWCDGSWLEDQDFWRLSGIFREVYLYALPAVYVEDYVVSAGLDSAYRNGLLEVRAVLANTLAEDWNGSLRLGLCGPDGMERASDSVRVRLDGNRKTECLLSAFVEEPEKWSAELPNLYRLYLELAAEDGSRSLLLACRAGFRTFEIRDGLMLLNGKRIVFQGMNRHEFNCRTGRVITEEEMREDIRLMKQCNINAVRTCHYPDHQRWYDLCDEYGIYVMDETNLETHGTWTVGQGAENWRNVPGSKPWWTKACIDRADSMLRRDRNHACVLIWSLGNESFGGENFVKMHDFLREEDPTRPVHYEGVFWHRATQGASDMESQMYTSPAELKKYAREHPEKPVILCEYSHGTGNSGGNLREYTDLFEAVPRIQGGFIWDWKDKALLSQNERGEEYFAYGGDFGEFPNSANEGLNGMLFADGTPQPQLWEVKRCYENVRFSLKDPENMILAVKNAYLFRSLSGLCLVWSLERNGKKEQEGTLSLQAAAGETQMLRLPLSIPQSAAPGERVILNCSARLTEDTAWAFEGHECAFAQFPLPVPCRKLPGEPESGLKRREAMTVQETEDSLRIRCSVSEWEFDKRTGELTAFAHEGKNLLRTALAPYFWRAQTDNDRGCGQPKRSGVWKEAAKGRKLIGFFREDGAEGIKVETLYRLPTDPFSECRISYQAKSCGRLRVEMDLLPGKGLPEIPAVGFLFSMEQEYDRVTWLGNGPQESYWDRKEGVKWGLHSGTVQEQYVPYVRPQECGNKTEVRQAVVSGRRGGLFLGAEPEMELSVLPWEVRELEGSRHAHELPVPVKTVVRVNLHQMGVGGDRCWGDTAVAHPEYLLHAGGNYHFAFYMEGLAEEEVQRMVRAL